MKKLTKILYVVGMLVLFLINSHIMDITNNTKNVYRITLNNQLLCDVDSADKGTTNGFWDNNDKLYHLAWYMNYIIIFIYTFVCLKCIVK